MKKAVWAPLAVASLGASFAVMALASPAMADGLHCTQYAQGRVCINEIPSSTPGGAVILSRFDNNKGGTNNVSIQLWAKDRNWLVGSNPSVGSIDVAAGDQLVFSSNGMLYAGNCHDYVAKAILGSGKVLTSPTVTYCFVN